MRGRIRDITNNRTLATSVDCHARHIVGLNPEVMLEAVFEAPVELEYQYLSDRVQATSGLGHGSAAIPPRFAVFEATKIG